VAVGDRDGPAIGGEASLVAVEGERSEAVDVVRGYSGHIVRVNGGRGRRAAQKVCKRRIVVVKARALPRQLVRLTITERSISLDRQLQYRPACITSVPSWRD
jgi:hypothetical protein